MIKTDEVSEKIYYTVLLSLDGVYKNDRHIESESNYAVPNDYIIRIAGTDKQFLIGASVHPYREPKEMLAETRYCIDNGAVLFNWIPSVQQIDPEDDRCIPFYICLAREGIPLLCHNGLITEAEESGLKAGKYNDPGKLRKALDIGVKVIAVHCTPYCNGTVSLSGKGYWDELMEMLRMSAEKKWDLYTDMSFFNKPVKIACLEKIKREDRKTIADTDRFVQAVYTPSSGNEINVTEISSYVNSLSRNSYRQSNQSYGSHKFPLRPEYIIRYL